MLKLWQLSFSVVCFPVRRNFLERRLVHTIIFSFIPRQTCGRGNLPFLEKKERRENKDMEPYGSLLLTGGRCCTKCQIMHAKKVESMKLTRCAEHMSFTYARGCARLRTKDYMQHRQDLYKRWLPKKVPATAPYEIGRAHV